LYPKYDEAARILSVASRVARPWTHGVDVDATLVCDLDANRMLANFDVHAPADRWIEVPKVPWPDGAAEADLVFTAGAVRQKSFALEVDVYTDRSRERVGIKIGAVEPDQARQLSEACVALTHESELVGFLLKLPPAAPTAQRL
jgi:hypothetical protein